MAEDNLINLSPELLADFHAECDEHLHSVEQAIVALEQGGDEKQITPVIQKLFRSFHSLKGIIGMVGIRPAEQLAHRAEDYLRVISNNKESISQIGLDLLAGSAKFLRESVAAFRDKKPISDSTVLLREWDALISGSVLKAGPEDKASSKNLEPALADRINEAAQKGLSIWRCAFAPSPELNERGINVNDVRERLTQLGEIIYFSPRIDEGSIAFEFFVATNESSLSLSEWQKQGVTVEQVQLSAPPPASAPASVAKAQANPLVANSQIVRVELNRLDELMRITGELVIQRARFEEHMNRLDGKQGVDIRGLQEVYVGFGRQFRELRETVMRLRMVPISELFDRLPFVVRDLTRGTKKKVRLDIQGQQTELDKFVVERLKDPLLHLVRNAVSHGIEDSDERVAAGKSAEGTLTLSAKTSGETVIIDVFDDGRGINRAKIAERAAQMKIPVPGNLTPAAILDLICLPGFSTRDEADRAAGRGVGMAVVSNTLRELGGSLALEEKNDGTHFLIRLPLTLLIADALIVSAHGQQFAIPQTSVEEVLQIEEATVRRMEQSELVSVRGVALPLIRLRKLFGFPQSDRATPSVLVSQTDRGRVGLVVDRINGQRQIVIRSLRDPLTHVPGVIGATELGDGKPLLILDPLTLAKQSGTSKPVIPANIDKDVLIQN